VERDGRGQPPQPERARRAEILDPVQGGSGWIPEKSGVTSPGDGRRRTRARALGLSPVGQGLGRVKEANLDMLVPEAVDDPSTGGNPRQAGVAEMREMFVKAIRGDLT